MRLSRSPDWKELHIKKVKKTNQSTDGANVPKLRQSYPSTPAQVLHSLCDAYPHLLLPNLARRRRVATQIHREGNIPQSLTHYLRPQLRLDLNRADTKRSKEI